MTWTPRRSIIYTKQYQNLLYIQVFLSRFLSRQFSPFANNSPKYFPLEPNFRVKANPGRFSSPLTYEIRVVYVLISLVRHILAQAHSKIKIYIVLPQIKTKKSKTQNIPFSVRVSAHVMIENSFHRSPITMDVCKVCSNLKHKQWWLVKGRTHA